jgi:HD superfamily phosphohydrolase
MVCDTQTITDFLLASLLHDIGHYDFAHYREECGTSILSHEQVGRGIIEKSEIDVACLIAYRRYHIDLFERLEEDGPDSVRS